MTTHKAADKPAAKSTEKSAQKEAPEKETSGSTAAEAAPIASRTAPASDPALTKASEVAAPGTSQVLVDALEKQREEVHKARLEAAEKSRRAAADEHATAMKDRAEKHAERARQDVKPVSVKVKNPTSVTQEVGLHGVTYYVKPGESELYPPAGVGADQLRLVLRRLQVLGVTVEEEEKADSKGGTSKSAGSRSASLDTADDYEPTEEEIQSLINAPTEVTVVDQPTRKPSNNGTMTDEQLEEATRAWAVGEIKAARAGKAHSDLVNAATGTNAANAKRRIAADSKD